MRIDGYDVGAVAGIVGGGASFAFTGWIGLALTVFFYICGRVIAEYSR